MSNRLDKPMLTPKQLIEKMRDEKGITFRYMTEEKAEAYLSDVNNYLRTASYRQNYPKNILGVNKGKYIDLDFLYLKELSTVDMHFRFIVSKMCMDIEQALKVKLIRDVTIDKNMDGYDIVKNFLSSNPYIVKKLEGTIMSPFTGDLICKYFSIQRVYNQVRCKNEHQIIAYDDCPIWVLCEVLTFGDFMYLYDFYYGRNNSTVISSSVINLVKSLRNGAAHNNCLLANLKHGTSRPPREINDAVKKINEITTSQRQKKLSCRPMLEFTALVYVYNKVVTEKVKYHRLEEIRWLFFTRMPEKSAFFQKNDLIKTNYEFACKLIKGIIH